MLDCIYHMPLNNFENVFLASKLEIIPQMYVALLWTSFHKVINIS